MKTTSGFINKAKLGAAATAKNTRQRKPITSEIVVLKILMVLNNKTDFFFFKTVLGENSPITPFAMYAWLAGKNTLNLLQLKHMN